MMAPPNVTVEQDLDGGLSPKAAGEDVAESSDDLRELVSALWLTLSRHVEATADAIRLDIKLAASSLMALLVTGIVVAALLVGLWFLGMGLLFSGLVALEVSKVVALLLIVLIQLLLLFFCHRFSKRMLANLNFQATRSSLPETAER